MANDDGIYNPDLIAKLKFLAKEAERVLNGRANIPLDQRTVGYAILAFPLREDGRANITHVTNLKPEALLEVLDMIRGQGKSKPEVM